MKLQTTLRFREMVITSVIVALFAAFSMQAQPFSMLSLKPLTPPEGLIEHVFDLPLDMTFYNPCCDEEVYMTGTGHLVINKNTHHVNVSGITGVGLSSGYTYTSLGTQVLNNVMYSSPVEGTLTLRINMRNEDGCSFKVIMTFHITVNAHGEEVVGFQTIETQCLD